jgi:hypothetical protein
LAHERLTGPTLHEWFRRLREIGRPVEPADLQPDLAYYGIRTSSEVQAWWVAQLNDPVVETGLLGKYLCRLADPFFWPPSMMTEFVDWLGAMGRDKQLELLSGEPPTKWRRTLLAIGEVLLNRQRYDAAIVAAATVALQNLRPTPTPN